MEYGGGSRRGFVIIPEARGGRGWSGFALEPWRVLEAFQMTYGGGKVPLAPVRRELAVVVDKRSLAEEAVQRKICWS